MSEIFNNREIAIAVWVIIAIVIFAFIKPFQQFLKSVIPIPFCRKFVVFYIVFLSYFSLVIYMLYLFKFWTLDLLKDTVFWIVFVELPLFAKTIDKAKDNHFFSKLIKENIAIVAVIGFVLNYWAFSLLTEIIIVPITIFLGLLYALASKEKQHQKVKHFLDGILAVFAAIVIVNTIVHIFQNPEDLFNVNALKELLLPILLLLLNLPIVYGLALYNTYEQVFIRVKGKGCEKSKMKRSIARFAGISLPKITAVHNNPNYVTVVSLTNDNMKVNLKKLEGRLSVKIGDNYMKRVHFYIMWCVLGLLACAVGMVLCNTQVSIKDMFSLNFTLNIPRIKEILTYICASGVVASFCLLIYAIGLKKKKNEEISQVKKYALHSFLYLLQRQHGLLQAFPPVEAPKELFLQYIVPVYEMKAECDKSLVLFENLLTTWELDSIRLLQTASTSLVLTVDIDTEKIREYTPDSFSTYFMEKKAAAPQNEKINVFIHDIEKGVAQYSEQIKLCYDEFKSYIV